METEMKTPVTTLAYDSSNAHTWTITPSYTPTSSENELRNAVLWAVKPCCKAPGL